VCKVTAVVSVVTVLTGTPASDRPVPGVCSVAAVVGVDGFASGDCADAGASSVAVSAAACLVPAACPDDAGAADGLSAPAVVIAVVVVAIDGMVVVVAVEGVLVVTAAVVAAAVLTKVMSLVVAARSLPFPRVTPLASATLEPEGVGDDADRTRCLLAPWPRPGEGDSGGGCDDVGTPSAAADV
jgi:hypothetical protein